MNIFTGGVEILCGIFILHTNQSSPHSINQPLFFLLLHRCPWMNVVPYHGKIQDKDSEFYKQFKVVISGLDNVEARR